jgi:hypothetical protein
MTKKLTEPKPKFPHSMFPFRVEHKEGDDNKICWFQSEDHARKYIEKSKLKSSEYKLESNNVEIVGKSTRRKGTQKRSSRRQSSSN